MDWQEKESSRQEYDCVICNQTTPSTEDEPMGLVVLVQVSLLILIQFSHTNCINLPDFDFIFGQFWEKGNFFY